MKKVFIHALLLIIATTFLACDGDYRKNAVGPMSEVLIVMDSTAWDSETADAIRETFGGEFFTLPRPEERFDIRFMSLRTQRDLDRAKSHKSVIFAAPINDNNNVAGFMRSTLSDDILERVRTGQNFSFPLRDRWYRDQWTLFLTAGSDEQLAQKIRDNEHTLINSLNMVEIERWKHQVYRRGEQTDVADSLRENHGFNIRVQHDYNIGADTTGFVTMRRFLPDNDRWIWFWYSDEINTYEDFQNISSSWINEKRDEIMERRIRGSRADSYVQTEFRRPVETRKMSLNGFEAYETRGTWKMMNDLMGGPFLHYTIWDAANERVIMMEFAQFAPRYSKRRFVYQFEGMAHTFTIDEEFSQRIENSGNAVSMNN